MRKAVALAGTLFLAGCAAMSNAGRPSYRGPTIAPLWHDATLSVGETPAVASGRVYVAGLPQGSSVARVAAYNLATGRHLWTSDAPASHIFTVAGTVILTANGGGAVRALDTTSGRTVRFAAPGSPSYAAYANGTIYAAEASTLSALRPSGPARWTSTLPVKIVAAPIVAGSTVVAYGVHHVDESTPDTSGVFAFGAERGMPRWKREWRDRFGKYRYNASTQKMAWKVAADYRTIGAILADEHTVYIWESLRDQNVFPTASLLTAVDALTGKVRWQHRGGPCAQPPALLADGGILACAGPRGNGDAGSTYVALRRSDGATLWHGETTWDFARSVAFGRYAIVSDRRVHQVLNENNDTSPDSWLTLVDLRDGNEVWRTEQTPLAVFTLPAYGDGVVVVGSAPFTWADPRVAGSRDVAGVWAWRIRE